MTNRGTMARSIERAAEFDSQSMERALAQLEAMIRGLPDLMSRRQIREGLVDVEEALTALNNARQELISVVAHDLKNLLAVILMSSALLGRLLPRGAESEKADRHVMNIQRTAERMRNIIQDFLDFARIENGRLALDPKPYAAAALISSAVEVVQASADQKTIVISRQGPQEPFQVNCDPERVTRVLLNLLGNAVKFTSEGGRIGIGAERMGKEGRFFVVDNGPGIPPSRLTRVFDPYWQVLDTSRKGGGPGLGLAIAKGIVEAHGGRIWAESSGTGSRFFFTLPVAP